MIANLTTNSKVLSDDVVNNNSSTDKLKSFLIQFQKK